MNKLTVCTATLATLFLGSYNLYSAGFALQEHSISGLGVGFASGAAGGSDNSSMFFNPATLSLYSEPEITSGLHFILPNAKFKNTGSVSGFIPGVSPGVPTQGPNATSDTPAIVPNFFYSRPLNEGWAIGLSVSSPYGLATEYDDGWVGRYIALDTDLLTVNTNLALSHKVSEKFAYGFGFSLMYGDALLSNALNFGLIYLNSLNSGTIPATDQTLALAADVQSKLGSEAYDGKLKLEGDDIGYGFNFGMLFTPSEATRIGVHYRSKVKLTLDGKAKFVIPSALDPFFGSLFVSQGGKVDIDLPDTFQASIFHQVSPEWAVMADIFFTWWSKFDQLVIQYETGFPSDSVIPENWDDTFRYSVGTTYQMNDKVELRAGLVYDESGVTSDTYRSPRIPDENRVWISLGMGYKVSDTLKVDVGFVHIFVDDPVIDNPTHTPGEYLKGTMDATVDILSVSGTWKF
ncbi:hypothetical protein G0Q06_00245 [Puniceicoccales bacterium CK1056]|uniref:Long-chain fatty acid transport protein n=1 Tax=Oceanipulchritudo coccoides TaxID=2706888 RepID=A0A6B2LZF3_9BACT|nr:hypothetical protein [Oceanipulchritudo coccoides]